MTDDDVVVEVEAACLGAAAWPGPAVVGRVVDAGPGGRHVLGARVVVGMHQPCGECDVCRRGGAPVCPTGRTVGGALTPRVTARARWVLVLDDTLAVPGPAAALLGHHAALAYALYARAGVGPSDPAVVIGDSAIARLLVEILIAKGAPPIAWTVDADLATWAAGRGAVVARNADDANAALRAHGDRPAKLFACDADGDAAARAVALAGARAIVAVIASGRAVDVGAALAREVTVLGIIGAHPDLFPELAALAVRGELDLAGAAEVIRADEVDAARARGERSRAIVVASP